MSGPGGPIWMVPRRRDPGFVGRGDELAALETALASTGRSSLTQPASVHGLGGVGKTLLAVEFAHRHADDYDTVLWLAAENPTALASAFADLARTLGLPEAEEPDQATRTAAVLHWLGSNTRWLLVFDNAERREDLDPYVPARIGGHVLITSRNPDWGPLARGIKVRPLPRADSIVLLRSGLESGDLAEADRLAEALGDLPLALAQANAFIRETGISFTDYLARFQARWDEFDGEQDAEPGYGETVAVTLSLALDRLRRVAEEAGRAELLLVRCAFYAPDRIPRDLLVQQPPDAAALDGAIRTLRKYSLIETDAGFLTVHRLVQCAVRARMAPGRQAEFAGHAVQQLADRFPMNPDDVATWPDCRKLLDHALHAAEHALERNTDVEMVAGLLNRVGVHLVTMHDLSRAKQQLGCALRIKESSYGLDHPSVAVTLNNLGNVAQLQGDLAEARRCQERALRITESSYGPEHPEVAAALGNLGVVAKLRGDLTEARRCQERALRIKESSYGPDHSSVAVTLGNLGIVAQLQGDLGEALRCHERALRIEELTYGPDHPEVARSLGNLGILLDEIGEPEKAVPLVTRALETFRKFLGDVHPLTTQAGEQLRHLQERIRGSSPAPIPGGEAAAVLELQGERETKGQPMKEREGRSEMTPSVGIITALAHETAAIRAMLGDPPSVSVAGTGAGRLYWVAEVASPRGGVHRVAIAQTSLMGNNSAAVRASLLSSHFPEVESIIMCGIAGGIPHPTKADDHVRLGDIVVSNEKGVVQYDLVKRSVKGKTVFKEVRSAGHRPSAELFEAVQALAADEYLKRRLWEGFLAEGLERLGWTRPDASLDVLKDASGAVSHPTDPRRREGQPRVFLGPIASGNTLLKDPTERDALRDQFGARAVEMEGAGIVEATWTRDIGYLVVRGICDYCNADKNDVWQNYAATAAAAYVRALLESMAGRAPANPRHPPV